jgi:hypothetical protein
MLFAYLGPDTVLPLTSAFAAVIGVALMFGRQSLRIAWYAMSWWGRLVGLKRRGASDPGRRAHAAHAAVGRSTVRARRRASARSEQVEF